MYAQVLRVVSSLQIFTPTGKQTDAQNHPPPYLRNMEGKLKCFGYLPWGFQTKILYSFTFLAFSLDGM